MICSFIFRVHVDRHSYLKETYAWCARRQQQLAFVDWHIGIYCVQNHPTYDETIRFGSMIGSAQFRHLYRLEIAIFMDVFIRQIDFGVSFTFNMFIICTNGVEGRECVCGILFCFFTTICLDYFRL